LRFGQIKPSALVLLERKTSHRRRPADIPLAAAGVIMSV
jgi:hypothetical protein